MSDARAVHMHELRPGDVFADPSGGAPFMVISHDRLDRTTVSLLTMQWQAGEVTQGLVFADAFATGYVPTEYPTEAVDDMPSDWWPTDKED